MHGQGAQNPSILQELHDIIMTWTGSHHSYYLLLQAYILNLKNAIPDKDNNTGYALIISIIGSISVGSLHYRLCYSIKFIITLNEDLGLQLLAQNFSIFHRFCVCIVKNLNYGAPGLGPLVIS